VESRLCHGDCIAGLKQLEAGSVDLAFRRSAFNIGYDYDTYQDDHKAETISPGQAMGEQIHRG